MSASNHKTGPHQGNHVPSSQPTRGFGLGGFVDALKERFNGVFYNTSSDSPFQEANKNKNTGANQDLKYSIEVDGIGRINFESLIFGRSSVPISMEYVCPDLIAMSPNLSPDMIKGTKMLEFAKVPGNVKERAGAITVQPSCKQDGAWQISPLGDHVGVSIQFQCGIDARLGYVTTGEHFAWDRNEYVEKHSFFFSKEDWSVHAPEILLHLAKLTRRTKGNQSGDTSSIRQRMKESNNTGDAITENLKRSLPVSIETNDTLGMLVGIYSSLPASKRSEFKVTMNHMMHHGNSDLNLYSSNTNTSPDVETLEARANLAEEINNASFEDLMRIAGKLNKTSSNILGEGLNLISGKRNCTMDFLLKDASYCHMLDTFIDLAIATKSQELEGFFEKEFTPRIKEIFEQRTSQILPLEVWKSLSKHRHLARLIGLVLLESGGKNVGHLRDNFMILTMSPENANMVKQLSESMVHSGKWRDCQWQGILDDPTQRARSMRAIQELLDLGSIPKCMRKLGRQAVEEIKPEVEARRARYNSRQQAHYKSTDSSDSHGNTAGSSEPLKREGMSDLEILGLNPRKTYSPADLKGAYNKKVKQHHPDAGGDGENLLEVIEAYNRLTGE